MGVISIMVIMVAKHANTTLVQRLRLGRATASDQNVTNQNTGLPNTLFSQSTSSWPIVCNPGYTQLYKPQSKHHPLLPAFHTASTFLQIRLHTQVQFGQDTLKVTDIAEALASKNVVGLLLIMSFSVKYWNCGQRCFLQYKGCWLHGWLYSKGIRRIQRPGDPMLVRFSRPIILAALWCGCPL